MPTVIIANAKIADVEAALVDQYGRTNIQEKSRTDTTASWTFRITSKSMGKCSAKATSVGLAVSMRPHIHALLIIFTFFAYLLLIVPGIFMTIWVAVMYFVTSAVISSRFPKMIEAVQRASCLKTEVGRDNDRSAHSLLTQKKQTAPTTEAIDETKYRASMIPTNENKAPRSSDDVPAVQPKKRWGLWHWAIVGGILLFGMALLAAFVRGLVPMVNHLKICSNCREVTMALNKYAMIHGGEYPVGATANDAFRELVKEQLISDERVFSSPASPYVADGNIGTTPDYNQALQKNENHWAMTKGLTKPSLTYQSDIAAPLIFENPAVSSWPPQWNVDAANKPVSGRALKVHNVVSADERNGPAFGKDMSGYSIVIGRTDGSVTNEKLGAPNGGNVTVEPNASGKNIFEQAGHHEVLDVEKGPAPSGAPGPQIAQSVQFTKQTYRAIDDVKIVELISSDELEMRDGRINLICKYTRDGSKIRATTTVMGTPRAVYFTVTPDGLVDPDGVILYEPARHSAVMAKVEAERRQAQLDQSLFNAAVSGDANGVRAFLRQGARLNALNKDGNTPLFTAVNSIQIDSVRALLESGADPNFANSAGNTPLILAADRGGENFMMNRDRNPAANPILKLLLENKANIDAQNHDGETALMIACGVRNLEGCRILIAAGASRESKDRNGKSVFDLIKDNNASDTQLDALRTEKERAFLLDSRTPKKVLGSFQEYEESYGRRKQAPLSRQTEITDVELISPQYNNRSEIKIWFGSIEPEAISKRDSGSERTLFGKSTPEFEVLIKNGEIGYHILRFLDSKERDKCFVTFTEALTSWRTRYGDPRRLPNLEAEKSLSKDIVSMESKTGGAVAGGSGVESEEQKWRKLIVGGWNHHIKYTEYFENGRYVNHPRRGDDEPGKWQITGDILTHTPDNGQVSSNKIVSLDAKELALDFGPSSPPFYFERVEDAVTDKTMPAVGGQAGDASANAIPFLNCTLTYSSHSSYWSFYFENELRGKGPYLSKLFEGKGGASYDGVVNYVIEPQGEAKWKITTSWEEAKDDTQEIIFWITEGDMRSGTLKAVGNVYDLKGLPMWPDGERSMEMLFTRGKHLSGGGDGASGQQMSASETQTNQEIRIDPLAGGDDLDSACEVFSQRLVTAKDVSQLNYDQLRYAINFLYAKHGCVFAAREVQAVFLGRPWYNANPGISMDDIDAKMSMTEAANVKVLAEAKSRLKPR
jgi:hypothetical protein